MNPPEQTRWQPGQSGNPTGYQKGRRNLSTIIKALLEEPLDFAKLDTEKAAKLAATYEGRSGWEALVHVAYIKALTGDIKASEWLSKSAYGSRQIIEADPPLMPLVPAMKEAVMKQLEIQQAGQKVLASEAAQ